MKKLGYGCMRFPLIDKEDPKSLDYEKITQMIDTFMEKGFTYFDTAYIYHGQESECLLKKVLVERYPRESFKIATKLPSMLLKTKENVSDFFNEQLKKTGAGFFDYYLIHCLDEELYEVAKKVEAFEFLSQKKKEGKIKKLGFSFHDSAEMLDKILTEHPEMEFVQLQINYLDWKDENVQSEKCLKVAKKHNKEVIVMEPVKGGTLASLLTRAENLFKEYNPDMSIPSWAIRFAASCENVFMVLSGMSTMEQVLDNTSYMENFTPLTQEEKKLCLDVAEIIKESKSVPCTACRYCIDGCPKNIPIPEYFSLYNRFLKKEDVKEEFQAVSERCGKVSDCIECRQCEKHCPQHINIVDVLKDISKSNINQI